MLSVDGLTGTNVSGVLNSLGGNIGKQLALGIYIIPIAIVLFLIYMFYLRSKGPKAGTTTTIGALQGNTAFIYSITHRQIIDIRPFSIKRITDPNGNIERTVAIFPDTQKKGGFIDEFKKLLANLTGKGAQGHTNIEEIGWPFSEKLATSFKGSAWLAIYTLEANMQVPISMFDPEEDSVTLHTDEEGRPMLKEAVEVGTAHKLRELQIQYQTPFVTDRNDLREKLVEIEVNTERRISRIKASVSAADNYVQNAQPLEAVGKMQLIGMALVFVGLIALALELNSVGGIIGKLLKLGGG